MNVAILIFTRDATRKMDDFNPDGDTLDNGTEGGGTGFSNPTTEHI